MTSTTDKRPVGRFQSRDPVVCTDASDVSFLTKGRTYLVRREPFEGRLAVLDDVGAEVFLPEGRFELAPDERAEQPDVFPSVGEVERLRAEVERLSDEVSDLQCAPWPEWAERMKAAIRAESGYDGYDDQTDGVDLPAELDELISELRRQADDKTIAARVERETDQYKRVAEHYQKHVADLRAILQQAVQADAAPWSGWTLNDLRRANEARQAEWCPDQVPDLSFRGNELAGETGEACNVVKKLERERLGWRGSRATLEQLAEELADVVICADLTAMTAGVDLHAAVAAKFNATSEKVGLKTRLPMAEPSEFLAADAASSSQAGTR